MKTEKILKRKPRKMTDEALLALKSRPIDFSDIPEITDFSGFRPRNLKPAKKSVSVRMDSDVLEWLKSGGDGYQQRLNDICRWAMQHGCPLA